MWHGPFRVREACSSHAVRLEFSGTPYRLFPSVHIFKLKRVNPYPDLPRNQLNVDGKDRLDFDESMLPEDSWECTLDEENEVDKIMDVRLGIKPRLRRIQRQ